EDEPNASDHDRGRRGAVAFVGDLAQVLELVLGGANRMVALRVVCLLGCHCVLLSSSCRFQCSASVAGPSSSGTAMAPKARTTKPSRQATPIPWAHVASATVRSPTPAIRQASAKRPETRTVAPSAGADLSGASGAAARNRPVSVRPKSRARAGSRI